MSVTRIRATRSTSELVVAACERRSLPISDPLMIDGVGVELAEHVRASLLQWAEDIDWIGRTPLMHRHGWKSPMGALEIAKPGCRELAAAIAGELGIQPRRLQTWTMINRAGAEHMEHTHGRVDASGVYYLDTGGTPTEFRVPGGVIITPPKRGRLVVFSGWIPHRVRVITEDMRVTIAFNVL